MGGGGGSRHRLCRCYGQDSRAKKATVSPVYSATGKLDHVVAGAPNGDNGTAGVPKLAAGIL